MTIKTILENGQIIVSHSHHFDKDYNYMNVSLVSHRLEPQIFSRYSGHSDIKNINNKSTNEQIDFDENEFFFSWFLVQSYMNANSVLPRKAATISTF